jgi:hypothetical protein
MYLSERIRLELGAQRLNAMVAFEVEQTVACAREDKLYSPYQEGMGAAEEAMACVTVATEGELVFLESLHRQPPPLTTNEI